MKTVGAISVAAVHVLCAGFLRPVFAQLDGLGFPSCALNCTTGKLESKDFCPDFEVACACEALGVPGSIQDCARAACNQTEYKRTYEVAAEACLSEGITLPPFSISSVSSTPENTPTPTSLSSPIQTTSQRPGESSSSSPSPSPSETANKSELSNGAIAGIVVGVAIPLIGAVAFVGFKLGIGRKPDIPVVPLNNDPETSDYGGIQS
ncbi:hypothetical protein Dda_2398 [Drechslerella dactyloides]|uniref:CFEM domain-containing protein n=1 Tax=Drechslerella dactyloides TaxID=74499 RepID=A0AAD6J4C2_DREDA|nr:hypothetical protein Dda_2398 [Drechslerella dactyloides]